MSSKTKGKIMYALCDKQGMLYPNTLADSPSNCWGLSRDIVGNVEGRAFALAVKDKPYNKARSLLVSRGWSIKQLPIGSPAWRGLMVVPQPAPQPVPCTVPPRAPSLQAYTDMLVAQGLLPDPNSPTQPALSYRPGAGVAAVKASMRYKFKEAAPAAGDIYMVNNVPMAISSISADGWWIFLESDRGTRVHVRKDQLGSQYPLVSRAADAVAELQNLQERARQLNERQRQLQSQLNTTSTERQLVEVQRQQVEAELVQARQRALRGGRPRPW